MAEQAIKLKIAGKSYSFKIESEKEELYRLAEKEVNAYVASIKQNNFQGWAEQDYLGMAALKFAIANIDMKQSREIGSEDLKKLDQIGSQIDTYFNKIKG
ncbi:MAG: cell division protein ZapA [Alistipes sp.]